MTPNGVVAMSLLGCIAIISAAAYASGNAHLESRLQTIGAVIFLLCIIGKVFL